MRPETANHAGLVLLPTAEQLHPFGLGLARPHRWTAHRKLSLVMAARAGALNWPAAIKLYGVSPEELCSWTEDFDRFGLEGLKVTKACALRTAKTHQSRLTAVGDLANVAAGRKRGRPRSSKREQSDGR